MMLRINNLPGTYEYESQARRYEYEHLLISIYPSKPSAYIVQCHQIVCVSRAPSAALPGTLQTRVSCPSKRKRTDFTLASFKMEHYAVLVVSPLKVHLLSDPEVFELDHIVPYPLACRSVSRHALK